VIERAALLEARRQVLVARCAVQRLELVRDVQALRASLGGPRTALALAASVPAIALLARLAGAGRLRGLARAAVVGFALVRMARALVGRR
jgi:hypothetical protein